MTDSKSIVFFTHAPQGSLGDPSAAWKLIKSIKTQYGDDIDVTIVLLVNDKNKDAVMNIFKNTDATVISMRELDLQYHKGTINLDAILKKTDGIIFFPSFHHFKKYEIDLLQDYNKQSFVVTEYDLLPGNREIQLKLLGDFRSRCMQIDTGLAEDKLGIFCTEEHNTSNNGLSLSQIDAPSDVAFRDFLLDGQDSNSYHDTHQLFFGYYARLNWELDGHKANPIWFIESCLHMLSPEKSTVDFVLPVLPISEKDEGNGNNQSKSIEEIIAHLKKQPELIQGYKFEFWVKNKEGKMECLEVGGEGEKLIRFMNGYPFTPNTMDKLMKASDELVLVTGDQSLSEAISNGKIFIYQTMYWKEKLWESLKNTVAECLAKESKLYQFLAMQDKDSIASLNEFKEFFKTNKKDLQEEVIKLRAYILDNKNLYANLPSQLVNYLVSPTNYVTDCLKQNETLSEKAIADLIRVFPNETNTIVSQLKVQKKLTPNQQTFVNLVKADGSPKDEKRKGYSHQKPSSDLIKQEQTPRLKKNQRSEVAKNAISNSKSIVFFNNALQAALGDPNDLLTLRSSFQ